LNSLSKPSVVGTGVTPDTGVTVTNTGSLTLTFKAGSEIEFTLGLEETRVLETAAHNYKVTCIDISNALEQMGQNQYGPPHGVRPPRPPPPQITTTIATISYPSSALFLVTEGDTVIGAKFSSTVPMAEANYLVGNNFI
jgi:hypothetical protein